MGLSFICATYNEESEIDDLIRHVFPFVDFISIVDDVSTDHTVDILQEWWDTVALTQPNFEFWWHQMDEHSGLPETVKNAALQVVEDGEWVLMLDADERFAPNVLEAIREWLRTIDSLDVSHVYFQQLEIIDGRHVRTFQKSKLFRKEAVTFSKGIHEDDQFTGKGIYKPEWIVFHRKSSDKQKQRELEYLDTYKKLVLDGKIDLGRYDWLRNLHHYYKGVPNANTAQD